MFAPWSNSRVTVELRELLRMTDEDGNLFDLWAFDYPSYYKGEEKKAFEQKVIDHYFFRQIGAETPARFLHNFRTRIREIMPYYLEMYKTVEIMSGIDDPFGNVDVTETFEQETTDTSSGSSSGTTSNTDNVTGSENSTVTESGTRVEGKDGHVDFEHRYSNTPQGSINNLNDHLTEAAIDYTETGETLDVTDNKTTTNTGATSSEATSSGSTESESSTESNGTVKYTLTRRGNQGVNTYAHDMVEFRKSIINVDMMIINELNDLFLLVY